MSFRERLRGLLKRIRFVLDNLRAEWSLEWIDNILYYINGKTRVIVEEHFAEKGKSAEDLIEKTVIYENTHGGDSANVKSSRGKAS